VWLLNWVADGELRICVPMSDVINGQFDKGLKLLLGTGGRLSNGSHCRIKTDDH
jgi:hypothetical protein